MKRTIEEHAARFDERAPEYDGSKSEEYEAAATLVIEAADPQPAETILDLGTGTGAIALAIAEDADEVIGRDISDGMLEQARKKAEDRKLENVSFGKGSFRKPNVDRDIDIVTSNFAMHHLSDEQKREAIEVIAEFEPRRFVLGDVMFFGEPDPSEVFYSPDVDDPATVGLLADAITDAGFVLSSVEQIHEQVGVLVADSPATAAENA